MYLPNKYTTWYNSIISRAKTRPVEGYTERHHIIPKCLGGLDDAINLVRLTAREHFICHQLLVKMVPSHLKGKMALAATKMWQRGANQHRNYRFTGSVYARLKEQSRAYLSEVNRRRWADPVMRAQLIANKSKPHTVKRTEEHKQKLREAALRNKKIPSLPGANRTYD